MNRPAPTAHPIHDLLRNRWSPRAFADKPVPADVLRRLFEGARWAPSSYNEQPWRYIVATRDDKAEFERVLQCLIPFNQSWAKAVPVLAIGCAALKFAKGGKDNRHAYHDLGAASLCLTIQAEVEGLAVHQMAGIEPDKAREVLKIPPGVDAVTGIAIGYPGDPASLTPELRDKETAPRQRRAMNEFVFTGEFGRVAPFAAR